MTVSVEGNAGSFRRRVVEIRRVDRYTLADDFKLRDERYRPALKRGGKGNRIPVLSVRDRFSKRGEIIDRVDDVERRRND